jgi:hypothetical protein
MNFKEITKSIKNFLTGEKDNMNTEPTQKDIADSVKEAKIDAEVATEGLIDDEANDGTDAEDQDGTEDDDKEAIIHHSEIMKVCEEEVYASNDTELLKFFNNNKAFYDASTSEEAKNKIAFTINNKVFKLNS